MPKSESNLDSLPSSIRNQVERPERRKDTVDKTLRRVDGHALNIDEPFENISALAEPSSFDSLSIRPSPGAKTHRPTGVAPGLRIGTEEDFSGNKDKAIDVLGEASAHGMEMHPLEGLSGGIAYANSYGPIDEYADKARKGEMLERTESEERLPGRELKGPPANIKRPRRRIK